MNLFAHVAVEHGALLSELLFKPVNLSLLAARGSAESGIHAAFQKLRFETNTEQHDAPGCSLVCSASANSWKLTKTFSLKKGEVALHIAETLLNQDAQERDVLWSSRLTLGAAFVARDCRIETPAVSYFDSREEPILRMRWPKLADGTDLSAARVTGGETRRVYLADFSEGVCRIASPSRKLRIELRWDAAQLPYCWIDERADAISLAPSSGLPNAVEEGPGLVSIASGASATMRTEIRIVAT